MEFIEVNPLPKACQLCIEQYCDECEHMGERWVLTLEDERKLAYKAKEHTAARLQRDLDRLRRME